jgi:hypothetical protein
VNTDDHRGRYGGCFKDFTPLRDELTVTGEDDGLGRVRRDVHRDLPGAGLFRAGPPVPIGWRAGRVIDPFDDEREIETPAAA